MARTPDPLLDHGSVAGAPSLVVVTGVPGAGKTTLGSALAVALRVPFISLDAIKERLYGRGVENRDAHALRLAAEADLVGQLKAAAGTAVVDIWIAPGRDTDRVARLLGPASTHITELLCRVPADLAVERYARRQRSGPHRPADDSTLQRIRDAVDQVGPVGIGNCIEVDTSGPVDIDWVLDRLHSARCRHESS